MFVEFPFEYFMMDSPTYGLQQIYPFALWFMLKFDLIDFILSMTGYNDALKWMGYEINILGECRDE